MTVTTFYNYGIEIFNIADMIRPGCLGTKVEFQREWCTTDNQGKGIVKGPDALGMYLREIHIVLRRSKAAYVKMVAESGQKVLLFGWHRDVYRIWAEELADRKVVWYTGSESPVQKAKNKQAFIDGEADGIQHCCSTVIFSELDWSPQIHKQCVGRLDWDGQLEEVFVIYVVTNYGSDPVVIDMQGLKSGQNQGITDPGKKEGD